MRSLEADGHLFLASERETGLQINVTAATHSRQPNAAVETEPLVRSTLVSTQIMRRLSRSPVAVPEEMERRDGGDEADTSAAASTDKNQSHPHRRLHPIL